VASAGEIWISDRKTVAASSSNQVTNTNAEVNECGHIHRVK
jgi:hypothetical protein